MKGIKKGPSQVEKVTCRFLALAVITVLAFGIAVPPLSATTIPGTQVIESQGELFTVNYDNITIKLDGLEDSNVLVGQVVQFYNRNGTALEEEVTLAGFEGDADGERYSSSGGRFNTAGKETGDYNVTGEGCNATVIHLGSTDMDLKLKKGTTTISSIPQGTPITVKFTSSLDPHDGVTLKATYPNGDTMKVNPVDNTVFGDSDNHKPVNVSHVTDLEINTAGWELGTYKFKVCTMKEYAQGQEKDSNEVELEIVSPELKIKAAKTEVVAIERVKLTVTGVPGHHISISVGRGAEHATFPANINNNPPQDTTGNFTDKIDDDGKREYAVYFDKIGSYTVKVNDSDSATEDFVDMGVSQKKVMFTMPKTCAIGANLMINGTANTGKTVDIAIDDVIVKVGVPIDTKGKFAVKLPTPDTPGTGTEDAITIKAFIDPKVDFSLGDDASGVEDDGSAMVLMVTGDLTADSSVSLVSPSDSFTLRGTAPGSKVVDILIVAPNGGSGHGMNPTNSEENGLPSGIIYEMASVCSGTDTWSIDIDVDEDADTGTYLAFVLTPGKNQEYDEIKKDDLLDGIADKYLGGDLNTSAAKTQEQINAILLDATTEAAGSDDYMKLVKIKVGKAELALYSPADVAIGDNLTISGASNREGHTIIVKVKGPIDLGTKFVKVEDEKFKATFSTIEALTGEYTIDADDGEGHTDTTTVNVIMPLRTEPTPAPTNTPASTPSQPIPELAPTTQPSETQPENSSASAANSLDLPVPGFEAVLVISALLTVYFLVVAGGKRRRA